MRELAIIESEKYSYKWEWVILIRVYNEAPVLLDTLNRVFDAGYTDIVIVDDGSNDGSSDIIKKFQKKHSHIIVLRHSQNRGWWAALETWFEYIRRYLEVEFVVTFDADGQHNIKDLEKFKLAFVKHPELDVLFGSRFFGKNAQQNIPFLRRTTLKLGKIFTRIMSWAKLTDSHNWYRMFRISAVRKIHLTADSMAYASELIEEIMKKNIPHGEIPVNIEYTKYSLSKWQKSSNAIFIAFHTIWSKFFK